VVAKTAGDSREETGISTLVVLAVLAGAQLMVILDATIVNVALPTIERDLGFSPTGLQWVVNAYTLTFGGFLLLGGRLGDRLGRVRLFLAGLTIFVVASLACGFAQNQEILIIARGVQGLGAAIISPTALAIITVTFAEGRERNRALAVWGAIAGSGGAIGLLLGGVLTEYAGWEWIFFVNVPLGLVVGIASARVLTESRAATNERADIAGAVTVTAGLIAAVYATVRAQEVGWTSTQTLLTYLAAVLLLGSFLIIESRFSDPLVPLGFFRRRSPAGANVVAFTVGAALFAMFFFFSLYLQAVLGYSALKAGLASLPVSVGIIVAATSASQLANRISPKALLMVGLATLSVGLLWFSRISSDGSYAVDVLGPGLLMAVGLGLTFVPLTISAVSGVPPKEAGLASGLLNTSQQVGGALGLAVLSTVSTAKTEDVLAGLRRVPTPADLAEGLTQGYSAGLLVGAGFAVAGIVIAALMIKVDRSAAVEPPPPMA
jgi:EmrB/QacA subfamily drug resistance transporter